VRKGREKIGDFDGKIWEMREEDGSWKVEDGRWELEGGRLEVWYS